MSKITPQSSQNEKFELKEQQHEQTPKQFLNLTLTLKISPLRPQNDPDLFQKHKLKLQEAQKIQVFQLHQQTQKQFLKITTAKKIAHLGSQKAKATPKLRKNQMSNLNETQKTKVVVLYKQTTTKIMTGFRILSFDTSRVLSYGES